MTQASVAAKPRAGFGFAVPPKSAAAASSNSSAADAQAAAAPAAAPASAQPSAALRHQLRSGKMFTAGPGRADASAESPAAADSAPAPAPAPGVPAAGGGFGRSAAQAAAPAAASAPSDAKAEVDPELAGSSDFGEADEHPVVDAPAASPAPAAAPAAAAPTAAPQKTFGPALEAHRQQKSAVANIHTAKVLSRLLEAIAHRPGMLADADVRTEALRGLFRQANNLGTVIAQGCWRTDPPDWLRAQAFLAASNLVCRGWESGMSGEQVKIFNAELGESLVDLAKEASAIAGDLQFDRYIEADTPDTAQGRLYVSISAAIGRLVQIGVDGSRAGETVREWMDTLSATDNAVAMTLDMRTAWLQGSLSRVTDLMVAVYQSPTQVLGGDDRLTDASKRAIRLFNEVEKNAKLVLESTRAPRPTDPADEPTGSAPVPRAG